MKSATSDILQFFAGFTIGALIDYVVVYLYKFLDPPEDLLALAVGLAAVQLMLSFYIAGAYLTATGALGIYTAQAFTFTYVKNKVYKPLSRLDKR